ncbi:MAG TPA: DHHA1 domain-containing protein [Alphaproteobacteria bacterium]|nr:DHHA1 domain-containing protein [Alphaproteobacteria bacterium]
MDLRKLKFILNFYNLKKTISSGVVILVSEEDTSTSLVVAVTQNLIPKIDAVRLVKIGAELLGGKGGGGRAEMAQAGGPANGKAALVIRELKQTILNI